MFRLHIYNKTRPKHKTRTNDQYYCSYVGDENVEIKWDYKNNHPITLSHV